MAAAFAYLIMTLYEEGMPRVFTALAAVGCAAGFSAPQAERSMTQSAARTSARIVFFMFFLLCFVVADVYQSMLTLGDNEEFRLSMSPEFRCDEGLLSKR